MFEIAPSQQLEAGRWAVADKERVVDMLEMVGEQIEPEPGKAFEIGELMLFDSEAERFPLPCHMPLSASDQVEMRLLDPYIYSVTDGL